MQSLYDLQRLKECLKNSNVRSLEHNWIITYSLDVTLTLFSFGYADTVTIKKLTLLWTEWQCTATLKLFIKLHISLWHFQHCRDFEHRSRLPNWNVRKEEGWYMYMTWNVYCMPVNILIQLLYLFWGNKKIIIKNTNRQEE